MQNAVNNLIFNTLITECRVVLPNVGSLKLSRITASMSGGRVVPPRYVVEFYGATNGRTIIDVIAHCAAIDIREAEDIYRRWLDKSRQDDVITIGGVGTLRHKSFTADAALLAALNPEDDKPLRLRRRHSKLPWLILSAVLLLGIAVGAYIYLHKDVVAEPLNDNTPTADKVAVAVDIAEPTEHIEVADVVADTPIEPSETVVDAPSSEEIVTDALPWTERQDLRHWVVVGSYSTEQNAKRAMRDITANNEGVTCDIFKLGSMYAVAAFASSERAECEEFVRNSRREFKQAWIHTPKRFK